MLGGNALIVGLTGKMCAGKDAFASLLPEDRFVVIDVDKLGHKALEENHGLLVEAFGSSIISPDGTVDRKILGPIVFSDPAKLRILDDITHPWMCSEALRQAKDAENAGKVAVINAALLESMGFVDHCQLVILVTAPLDVRMKRAMERNGMSPGEFMKRAEAQKDIGLSLFSSGRRVITIINDSTKDSLSRQVENCCGIIR